MDEARFERIYRANAPSILRYCAFSTGCRQDGEDIAAEVFSRLMTKGDRLHEADAPRWLFTVARNLCASHHRTRQRSARLSAKLAEKASLDAPAWSNPEVWLYVRALGERERLVVYLHAVEDRSFADVARLLGKSLSAVKMTYYRALDRIRAQMECDAVASPAPQSGGA